jgi:SAM-dependent methyltransferase
MDRSAYVRLGELEGEHWWFSARREILKSVIRRFAPQGRGLRLLEAGCGTGGNLRMLAEFGRLDAFELDREARAAAGTKAPVDIRSGRLPDDIPYERGSFDVIAAFDVIEHVERDVESLARLRDKLAPGGRLFMTVPALPWLWSQHDVTHHHYRRYTRKHLEEVLDRAGLKPVKISYYNTLLFPLIAAVRLVKNALGIRDMRDDSMPPPAVNAVLKRTFALEAGLVGRVPLPIGLSLLAVAERMP